MLTSGLPTSGWQTPGDWGGGEQGVTSVGERY